MSYVSTPDVREMSRFLTALLGVEIRNLTPLGAGLWSSAFSFDAGDASLVLRLGDQDEDFAKDRIAASWQQPGLPVPRFIDTGQAFGTFYAITERAHGTFLDRLSRREVTEVLPSVLQILDAQRHITIPVKAGFGVWDRNGLGEHRSWQHALLDVAIEKPRKAGWKRQLREWPECQDVFDEGFERLQALVPHTPSRQDVIHSDLVNRNVLVANGDVVSVFDWGSSMYGDHLYDIAWLTYCTPWTSGFDRQETLDFFRQHFVERGIDREDFDRRIGCYELHVAVGCLAGHAFLEKRDVAQWVAGGIVEMLKPGGSAHS